MWKILSLNPSIFSNKIIRPFLPIFSKFLGMRSLKKWPQINVQGFFSFIEQIFQNIKQEYSRYQRWRHLEVVLSQSEACTSESQPPSSALTAPSSPGKHIWCWESGSEFVSLVLWWTSMTLAFKKLRPGWCVWNQLVVYNSTLSQNSFPS